MLGFFEQGTIPPFDPTKGGTLPGGIKVPPINPGTGQQTPPAGQLPADPPERNQPGGGGSLQVTATRGCRPTFNLLGDNSEWFVFTGVEVGLVVLMLIGILAILFGDPEQNQQVVEIAEHAAVAAA